MAIKRYEQLKKLVGFVKPKVIIEVGTHKGVRAEMMCREAVKHQERVHYIGYDLFDEATAETNEQELNGKGAGSEAGARSRLENIDGLTFEFIKGNTRDTLHGKDVRGDFVFIDGGHSVETIRGDYEALKASRMIAFDDWYDGNKVDLSKFGCNEVLRNVRHEILPEADNHNGLTIRLAVVGYAHKWHGAVERLRKKDGHKDFVFWRGGETVKSDLVCACNTLECEPDVDAALESIKKLVRKRALFVVKADAICDTAYWRKKLEKHFQILEWMEPPDSGEAVAMGMPLAVVGEWQSRGVMDDDKRFDQTKANCAVVSKRVNVSPDLKHDRKAVIVCYGPSLLQTWPELQAEETYMGADLFSVSGAHDFMVRRGIKPTFHVECDPRPHKAANLNMPQEGVQYLIASCCHPELIDKLKDFDLSLWHLCNGQDSFRIMEEIESEKNQVLITGGGSVGLRSIALAYAMGYREFHIYGMDCSFSSDEEPKQWAGPHKGKKQKVIDIKTETDRWFKTSPVLVTYARHFFDTVQRAPDASFYLAGDGLLQEMGKISMQQEDAA
jgi:uncharacterized Rossmann fold enzyme